MGSRFSHLHLLFQSPPPVERQQSHADREKERRQIRADMEFGRRSAQKQAAQQAAAADPDAARLAHDRAIALAIINAGQARRGMPLLKRLIDDEPSDEYPPDSDGPDKDPSEGDD
jgi:hypothetical protein